MVALNFIEVSLPKYLEIILYFIYDKIQTKILEKKLNIMTNSTSALIRVKQMKMLNYVRHNMLISF